MSLDSIRAGWTATDEGEDIPVRSGLMKADAPTPAPVVSLMHEAQKKRTHTGAADPRLMHLSAVIGIGGVLLAAAFYFGFLNIQGLLTGSIVTPQTQTVTITAAGEFDPTSVTVYPGESVVFKNDNADPQVLKSKDDREIFPVQVLFEDPYTTTVPADANGTYVYFSETLPEDKTLTISVAAQAVASSTAPISEEQNIEIPIPPMIEPSALPIMLTSSVSSSVDTVSVSSGNGQGENTVINLRGETASSAGSVTFDTSKVPVNPYTVASGGRSSASTNIAKNVAVKSTLHSGAPAEITKHTPRVITESGPSDILMLLGAAFALFGVVYQTAMKRMSA